MRGLCSESQDDDRRNIIERNRADDHERRHAGIAVYILNIGGAEERGAAAVRGLNEFAARRDVPDRQRTERDEQDGEEGGGEAERDVSGIPDREEVFGGEVLEEENRERHAEDEPVHAGGKDVVEESDAAQEPAEAHHKEYGHCCVQTENQILHGIPASRGCRQGKKKWLSASVSAPGTVRSERPSHRS